MRRIALCAVVCLSLSGALAQARPLSSTPSSRSTVSQKSAHTPSHHKRAKKHRREQTTTKLSTTTTKPSLASPGESSTLFGDTTVEPGLDSNTAGWAEAFPYTSRLDGRASSIEVYLAPQNKATSLVAGIYSNSSGDPRSLLTSGTLSSLKAGAWNKVPVASTSLKSGKYWIGLLGRRGVLYFNDRSSGSCVSESSSQTSATSLSATWPAGGPTWSSCPLSAYVIGSPMATVASTGGADGGSTGTTTTSAPTSPLPPGLPPVNALAPSVSGNATDGQTLNTSDGTWLEDPSSFTYQWQDCNSSVTSCSDIAGATGSRYALGSGDVGHTVRSVVTASNAGGSSSARSAASAIVTAPVTAPSNTAAPAVSGTTTEGQSLSTSNGSWSGSPSGL